MFRSCVSNSGPWTKSGQQYIWLAVPSHCKNWSISTSTASTTKSPDSLLNQDKTFIVGYTLLLHWFIEVILFSNLKQKAANEKKASNFCLRFI